MKHRSKGFTILELLITAAIGAVIIGTIASVIVSQTREGLVIERSQRAREDMNRLALFLDNEISEGDLVTPAATLSGCTNSGNSVFSIRIPYWSGNTRTSTTSQYYVDASSNLRRCGPPISSDGELNHSGTRIDSILSSNTNLTQGNATTAAARSISYTISIADGSGNTILTRSSKARTRVGLIDD